MITHVLGRMSLLVAIAVVATACASGSDAEVADTRDADNASTTTTSGGAALTTTSVQDESGAVDLTDQVLVSTDANCESHVGEYTSSITDVSTDQDFDGAFIITAVDGVCLFASNQIPSHDAGEGSDWRGVMAENELHVEVPVEPTLAAESSELGMGANVVMLNGVKWEAYPAACFGVGDEPAGREAIGCFDDQLGNPWRYNIGSPLNDFGFDIYLAHLQPGGLYHYHSTPTVLYDIDCDGTASSPVVGYAADGFPVYGPCFEDEDGTIRSAQSGYVLRTGERQDVVGYTTPYVAGNVKTDEYTGQFIGDYEYVDTAGDLDACNGMTVNAQYGYYLTGSYPYVLSCYSGTPSGNFR